MRVVVMKATVEFRCSAEMLLSLVSSDSGVLSPPQSQCLSGNRD